MNTRLKKATKRSTPPKVAIAGPSGSGKTYSALLLAQEMANSENPKIVVIDTERGTSEFYADKFDFYVVPLEPPFTPSKYVETIEMLENEGADVIIIDSLSHVWGGQGGVLDRKTQITKKIGNSNEAWLEVSSAYERLLDRILKSPVPTIVTLRVKTENIIEREGDRIVARRIILSPIMRDGIEYEFPIFLELGSEHEARVVKDRTGHLDGKTFLITSETGREIARCFKAEDSNENRTEVVVEKTDTDTKATKEDTKSEKRHTQTTPVSETPAERLSS